MLANDTLDDLLVLNTDRVPLKEFKPDCSIHMWWKGKTRRPNQHTTKEYKKKSADGDEGTVTLYLPTKNCSGPPLAVSNLQVGR